MLTALLSSPRGNPKAAASNNDPVAEPRSDLGNIEGRDGTERLLAEIDACNAAGLHARALALVRQALDSSPERPELVFARAETLFAWGRFHEALSGYQRVASSNWHNDALFTHLGWAHFRLGDLAQAEAWMRKAVDAMPDSLEALDGLTTVLVRARNFTEAMANCRRSLEIDPHDPRSLVWLGICALRGRDPIAAEARLREALAEDAAHTVAWTNLGSALHQQGRYQEALAAFERAHDAEQSTGGADDTYVNLARELYVVGKLEDALRLCDENLPQRPAVDGQIVYSEALAAKGCLKEAWDHYEFRWLNEPLRSLRHNASHPPWSGQDLHGKTVMLRVEQGFGDMIQFLRYAPHIRALGAKIILRKFSDLASDFPGIDTVFEGEAPPYDYYVNPLSLPRVFGTDLASIPADVPYLRVDDSRAARWAGRIGPPTCPRVGIVWAGNPAHHRDSERSIALRAWAPLLALEGVRWFSLQKGAAVAAMETLPVGCALVELGSELTDFSDTAAVISQLDLVVCVDTAVAHLAGALGKPVWLLVQSDADWRWLRDRDDSPWYPTMRLFRQRESRDWSEVINRVKLALERHVREGAALSAPSQDRPSAPPAPLRPVLCEWKMPHGSDRGFSAVTETRVGVVQYFPSHGSTGKAIGWYGECLQPHMDLLAPMIGPGATVVEVAPGVGVHSLALAGAVGANGHLFLIEWRPGLRRLLQQNLTANRVTNVTLLHNLPARPGSSSIAPEQGQQQTHIDASTTRVRVETLDEYLLEDLRLLKINEGADAAAVIDGAVDTLWRLRPLVFMAIDSASSTALLAARVKALGYRCWRMEAPLFNPNNFNCRADDIFGGATSLALLAVPEEVEVDVALRACTEIP
jgi:tetratricopeptide (TPR) repeat protein